jgi:hypothetical protein
LEGQKHSRSYYTGPVLFIILLLPLSDIQAGPLIIFLLILILLLLQLMLYNVT